ncbi:MAG: ParB/RepB/Spo0J family partition protein [Acidimicrobiia bacterium]
MSRPSGLGRGLGALIPGEGGSGAAGYRELPIDSIQPNTMQPRERFDEEALENLTASVRELGVLQPVLVRQVGIDDYQLIAGERRWRAARRAGLDTVPALVREVEDQRSLEQALVENLHREDLNPLEEAAAYQQLIEDFGLTQEQVATRVGKSRSAVTNTLRLFGLPAPIQALIADSQLSAGHGRALLAVDQADVALDLAERAIADGWTVRRLEGEVRPAVDAGPGPAKGAGKRKGSAKSGGTPAGSPPAALLELESLLAAHLDTSVSVSMGAGRGRIQVDFADIEDLERIYKRMSGG